MVWAVGTCFLDLNRIGLGLIFLVFVFYCSQRSEISGQLLSCDLSSDLCCQEMKLEGQVSV